MEKVIIVGEGEWGFRKEVDFYDDLIDLIKRTVEGEGAEVEIAKTFKTAQDILKKEEASALVFISRSMLSEARWVKDNYPRLKVVVFTGALPLPDEYPFSFSGLTLVEKGKRTQGSIRRTILDAILGPPVNKAK